MLDDWIGCRVEVRETSSKIEIQLDARYLVTHQRMAEAEHRHILPAEHRPPWEVRRPDPDPEQALTLKAVPETAGLCHVSETTQPQARHPCPRQLLRMAREYPRPASVSAEIPMNHC